MERALTLAEPEGYVRIFVDEDEPMAALLASIEAKDGSLRVREYVLKLLSAFDTHIEIYPSGSTPVEKNRSSLLAKQAAGQQPLVKPEVRPAKNRLLRTDLNGPEIARELMVSLSTVRTHTQNIYAKLGVNNRRAAVRRPKNSICCSNTSFTNPRSWQGIESPAGPFWFPTQPSDQ